MDENFLQVEDAVADTLRINKKSTAASAVKNNFAALQIQEQFTPLIESTAEIVPFKKKSRYTNVTWECDKKKWRGSLAVFGSSMKIGRYSDEDKAAEAVEIVREHKDIIEQQLKIVDPSGRQKRFREIVDTLLDRPPRPEKSSQFRGVSWTQQSKGWSVTLYLMGQQYNLGLFSDEVKASEAYEAAYVVRKDWERELEILNDVERRAKFRQLKEVLFGCQQGRGRHRSKAPFAGITLNYLKKWRARIKIVDKMYEIGVYEDPEEAGRHYEMVAQHVPVIAQQIGSYNDAFDKLKFVKSYIAKILGKEEKPVKKLPLRSKASEPSESASSVILADGAASESASSAELLLQAKAKQEKKATSTRKKRILPPKFLVTEGVHFNILTQKYKAVVVIDDTVYLIGQYTNRAEAVSHLELFQSQKVLLRAQLRHISTASEKLKYFQDTVATLLEQPAVEADSVDGVTLDGLTDEWVGVMHIAGKPYTIGRYAYDREQQARDEFAIAVARREFVEMELAKTIDPFHKYLMFCTLMADLFRRLSRPLPSHSVATVEWHPEYRLWHSHIHIEGRYFIGRYLLECEATAVAHYRAVSAIRDELCELLREVEGIISKQKVFKDRVSLELGCVVPVDIKKVIKPLLPSGRRKRATDRNDIESSEAIEGDSSSASSSSRCVKKPRCTNKVTLPPAADQAVIGTDHERVIPHAVKAKAPKNAAPKPRVQKEAAESAVTDKPTTVEATTVEANTIEPRLQKEAAESAVTDKPTTVEATTIEPTTVEAGGSFIAIDTTADVLPKKISPMPTDQKEAAQFTLTVEANGCNVGAVGAVGANTPVGVVPEKTATKTRKRRGLTESAVIESAVIDESITLEAKPSTVGVLDSAVAATLLKAVALAGTATASKKGTMPRRRKGAAESAVTDEPTTTTTTDASAVAATTTDATDVAPDDDADANNNDDAISSEDTKDTNALAKVLSLAGVRSKKARTVAAVLVRDHDVGSKRRMLTLLKKGTLCEVLVKAGLSEDDVSDVESLLTESASAAPLKVVQSTEKVSKKARK